jgi:hypothetical protein
MAALWFFSPWFFAGAPSFFGLSRGLSFQLRHTVLPAAFHVCRVEKATASTTHSCCSSSSIDSRFSDMLHVYLRRGQAGFGGHSREIRMPFPACTLTQCASCNVYGEMHEFSSLEHRTRATAFKPSFSCIFFYTEFVWFLHKSFNITTVSWRPNHLKRLYYQLYSVCAQDASIEGMRATPPACLLGFILYACMCVCVCVRI